MDTPLRFNMCYRVLHPNTSAPVVFECVYAHTCVLFKTLQLIFACVCVPPKILLCKWCARITSWAAYGTICDANFARQPVCTHECALVLFMHTANQMRVIIQGLFCALCAAHVCKLFAANFSFQRLCTPTTVKVTLHVWNGNCIIATEHFTLHSFRVK